MVAILTEIDKNCKCVKFQELSTAKFRMPNYKTHFRPQSSEFLAFKLKTTFADAIAWLTPRDFLVGSGFSCGIAKMPPPIL